MSSFLPSRNLLSTLPKYLFDLPLKVLVVSNNKLVSVPEEIGKLKDLMELVRAVALSFVTLNTFGFTLVCPQIELRPVKK